MRITTLLGLLLVVGCGNIDVNEVCPTPTQSFAALNDGVIKNSCAKFDVCHSARGKLGDLDLQTDPYNALVNAAVACTTPCTAAKSEFAVRVSPGNTDKSFLWKKLALSSSTDPKYGDRMPQSNPPLGAEQLKMFRCWIEGGAPNN